MEETFLPIASTSGAYSISDTGTVRSNLNRYKNTKKVFHMKKEITNKGYERVLLSSPVRKRYGVHRLVAEAFIPNPDNHKVVNHKDNNPLNNTVSNLEWCSQSQNMIHAQKQGRLFEAQSKGGKAAADKSLAKAIAYARALVGTKVNSWTILSYQGIKYSTHHSHQIVNCVCDCGAKQVIQVERLRNGTATRCTSCRDKLTFQRGLKSFVSNIEGKLIGTWKITAVGHKGSENNSLRKMKFRATCITCGYEDLIPQPSVIGTKKIKNCKNCKEIKI